MSQALLAELSKSQVADLVLNFEELEERLHRYAILLSEEFAVANDVTLQTAESQKRCQDAQGIAFSLSSQHLSRVQKVYAGGL